MALNNSFTATCQSPFPILPLPMKFDQLEGQCTLSPDYVIACDAPNLFNAAYLKNLLETEWEISYPVQPISSTFHSIRLEIDQNLSDTPEGYHLSVNPDEISISAGSTAGVFFGMQTFRQLLFANLGSDGHHFGSNASFPCLKIVDKPYFQWRGFMLDEGRHFQGKETVLRLFDAMAFLKMNIFHWHLTEDQGWRIEIKKYPRLTEIGAMRPGTARNLGDMIRDRHDGIPHGGFYTQDEIREIVNYAQERHITIVPEIELPGHSTAALAAYPEFSCTGGPFSVATHPGIFRDIFCAGNEETYRFLKNILVEILDLFPGPYIHIGGDEAPHTRWKKCQKCQERIAKEGLKDEHALQAYLTNRIAQFLEENGRRAIGWNEIVNDKLSPKAIAQFWSGSRRSVIRALRSGRQTILSPYLHYYLDHSYALTPLSQAYRYFPDFPEIDREIFASILGVEAPLWSECVPNWERLEFQVFPRLLAVAETGWVGCNHVKDFSDFSARCLALKTPMKRLRIHFAPDKEIETTKIRHLFGLFTILQPQRTIIDNPVDPIDE